MFAIVITSAAGAALCLALGLVLRLSGRLGAADRHESLTVAVALALLMPLLVLAMPISLRIDLPGRIAPHASVAEGVTRGTGPLASPAAAPPAAGHALAEASRAPASPSSLADASAIALGVWALGTLFFALRLARAGWLASRIRRRAKPFGADVDVVMSAEIDVPMVSGVLRPAILLPADAAAWSAEDLSLTLLHERAHVARHDVAKQWIASIAAALYWFNPLVWIAARAMASDREHAVDGAVLASGARASSYAALLLRVAVRAERSALLGAFHAPAVGQADLARRVEAILAGRRGGASRLRRATFAGAMVLTALAVACSQAPAPSPPAGPAPRAAGLASPRSASATKTPSAVLLEQALGGPSSLDPAKQAATEDTLDTWLAEDPTILRAHVIAMELPSGLIVAVAGRDRATGPTIGVERNYPPASTIKPLFVAAALEAGALKEDDILDGEGGSRELTSADGKTFTMQDHVPQGRMTLAKMLAVSSNVGATKVGERLGGPRQLAALDGAGLFLPVDGLSLAAPSRPDVARNDSWHGAIVSIGHNFSVNPLRLVAAYAALASDGDVISPRLRVAAPRTTSHFVSSATAHTVTRMLEGVVSEAGTGELARVPNLRVAGKTGTADLERVEGGVLYASFVGMFPVEAPRYVILVGAETHDGAGGTTAGPRFASLVGRAFR